MQNVASLDAIQADLCNRCDSEFSFNAYIEKPMNEKFFHYIIYCLEEIIY